MANWEGTLNDQPLEPLHTFDTGFKTHACLGGKQRYLQTYPCAACHLPFYEAVGVGYAKIGGRGRPLADRLTALHFLKQALTLADDTERAALYRQTFAQPCQCYYGTVTQSRDAIEPRGAMVYGDRRWLSYGETSPSTAYEPLLVGSENDLSALDSLLSSWDWIKSLPAPLTIVIPPLPQKRLQDLSVLVNRLYSDCNPNTHLCVNDLGSLRHILALDRLRQKAQDSCGEASARIPFTLTIGSLLAGIDDPALIDRFLDPSKNPSRIVLGPAKEPRVLTYTPPSPELIRHWRSPSALEPTARSCIEKLLDGRPLIYEFA
jgi:hypothetical protein